MHSVIRKLIKWNRLFSTIITTILAVMAAAVLKQLIQDYVAWMVKESILNPAFCELHSIAVKMSFNHSLF